MDFIRFSALPHELSLMDAYSMEFVRYCNNVDAGLFDRLMSNPDFRENYHKFLRMCHEYVAWRRLNDFLQDLSMHRYILCKYGYSAQDEFNCVAEDTSSWYSKCRNDMCAYMNWLKKR